jgi:tRNA nucleotidyltransferase (CCA-adding enzyme)
MCHYLSSSEKLAYAVIGQQGLPDTVHRRYNRHMFLILTHENADFDAVASQLAAHKLYPEGIPLLSRHINRNVRQFLILYWDSLPFMRPEDWRRQRVDRLMLVDTHSFNSVRGMVRDPSVTVIDHHLNVEQRPNWEYQVEGVGATTTLLVEQIRTGGPVLSTEEATLLLLGIYEDTGSLTYDTTTPRDAHAAGWLLEQGAQLAVARRFLQVALTESQQALYDRLQQALEWHEIHGQSLAIAATPAPDDFEDEISSVAHRLREILNPAGLFVLVGLKNGVQLVARSTSDQIDVSLVAEALGGGGHNRAAAALVLGESLVPVKERLVALLPKVVLPMIRVAEIMSYGVQTIRAGARVEEAAALMQRFGHEGYPVVDNEEGQLVGLLTRRAVDRAMSHGMERQPVRRIMRAGSVTVRPSDSIYTVQQLMLREGWGQIPVVDNAEEGKSGPIGIVTRTDLLSHLFRDPSQDKEPDMQQLLRRSLAQPAWLMVQTVGQVASDLNMPLYFVGGLVRDVLLGQPAKDLDMVVEGDAIKLVRQLRERFGGEVHTHARFGTAKWFLTEEIWLQIVAGQITGTDDLLAEKLPPSIDFVTARSEFYKAPSALPEVERGSIKLDLHRRDFTINTLAVRLDGAYLGQLLDFYGGQRDLEQGLVRVLHSLSFVDDPTRILRAVRLEQRLGFAIESRTAELIESSLPMLDRVTGDRIRHEIELALHEAEPVPVMARLAEIGVMAQLHPELAWTETAVLAYRRLPPLLEESEWAELLEDDTATVVYFALWLLPLKVAVRRDVMRRLKVRQTTRRDVNASAKLVELLQELPADTAPSEIAVALQPFALRTLLTARAYLTDEVAIDLLTRYVTEWRHVKTILSGNDLRQMGLTPGPEYGRILDALLAARLDGILKTEADERAFLARQVAEME